MISNSVEGVYHSRQPLLFRVISNLGCSARVLSRPGFDPLSSRLSFGVDILPWSLGSWSSENYLDPFSFRPIPIFSSCSPIDSRGVFAALLPDPIQGAHSRERSVVSNTDEETFSSRHPLHRGRLVLVFVVPSGSRQDFIAQVPHGIFFFFFWFVSFHLLNPY